MSSLQHEKRLMIMAAGTGGHIFPGLAIAETMKARGWTVTWLGTSTGMETQIVPMHGVMMDTINFTGLRGKGLKHSVVGGIKLLASFFTCLRIVLQRKPDVVLGMGGYVTVPGGLIARLCGKPLVLMNADAALLLSNKALRPLANKLLFGLPSDGLKTDDQVQVTGNPIRHEICNLPTPTERYASRTGVLKVLVVGGSLGAQVLNECLPHALALIPEEKRPVVIHQSGTKHIAALRTQYAMAGVEAEVVAFIEDMPRRYAQADLVICRAGAITISELTAAGVASILVPFAANSTSHQKQNARWLELQQAAIYLPQEKLRRATLALQLESLTREQCLTMASAAYALGERQATETIAGILEKVTEKNLA